MEQLTVEEKEILNSYRNSELFRVFIKSIDLEFKKLSYAITQAPIQDLQKLQGTMQGLLIAKNMIVHYASPIPQNVSPIKNSTPSTKFKLLITLYCGFVSP